ncbi:MAG: hypothetical protein HZB61_12275 [Nitrospirae bacterium]|nr:hypothetical protein [Nitrospirota bacterium]
MENFMSWIAELNKNNHTAFGLLTIGTMAGIGIFIAFVAEMIFKMLGIKNDKIEIQH